MESIKELPVTHTNLEVRDADGKYAPVLIVKTELKGLGFKNIGRPTKHAPIYNEKKNEYKFYMNDKQRVIEITHSEYEPLEVRLLADYNIEVNAQRVYDMKLIYDKESLQITLKGAGNLIIKTIPSGAVIKMKEYPDFSKHTPCELIKYPAITYNFTISKDRYSTIDTTFSISENDTITKEIKLNPLWGDLIITSEPSGSEVYVNKDYLGITPLNLNGIKKGLNQGEYLIEVKKEKYFSKNKVVNIIAGEEQYQNFQLNPRLGSLSIVSVPDSAQVEIDKKIIGYTPITISEMIVDEHDLKLYKSDFGTFHKKIMIMENEELSLNIKLTKTQEILIDSVPQNANLYVNGKFVGTTPNIISIPISNQKVRLEKNGYISFFKTLKVNPFVTEYDFKLTKSVFYHLTLSYGADAIAFEYGTLLRERIYTFGLSYIISKGVPDYVDHINVETFLVPESSKVDSYASWGMDFYIKKGFIKNIPTNYILNIGICYRFRIENPIFQADEDAYYWECEEDEYWTSYWESGFYYGKVNNYFPLIIGISIPIKSKFLFSLHYWTTFKTINDLVVGLGLYY